MRKTFLLLFLFAGMAAQELFAQTLSADQVKKILTANQWMLRRYEKEGKMYNVPEEQRGLKMVFMKNGNVYVYQPKEPERPIEYMAYNIVKGRIITGENVENIRYTYRLEELAGYKLYLSDNDDPDQNVSVWEQAEPVTGDGVPKGVFQKAELPKTYAPTPAAALPVIKEINALIKDSEGNLRFYPNDKEKETIQEVSFTASDAGVRFSMRLENHLSNKIITHTYEFMPDELKDTKMNKMDDASPVGSLRLGFAEEDMVSLQIFIKGRGLARSLYDDNVYMPYLKVDPESLTKLQKLLMQLKEAYAEKNDRLFLLRSYTATEKNFWISSEKNSRTYNAENVTSAGGTLRFTYSLQNVTTSGTTRDQLLTVVPLADIEEVFFDKSKSKPNTILLRSGKKGFTTYSKSSPTNSYETTTPVTELPLFIDVSNDATRERVMELLREHVRDLGGGKLSL